MRKLKLDAQFQTVQANFNAKFLPSVVLIGDPQTFWQQFLIWAQMIKS